MGLFTLLKNEETYRHRGSTATKETSKTIVMVIPDLGPGGAQPMNLRLARELGKRGWQVHLAALCNRLRVISDEATKDLNITFLGDFRLLDKLLLPFKIALLARQTKAALVMGGVEQAATTYGALAARLSSLPFVAWAHTSFQQHEQRLSRLDRTTMKITYRQARWVVFPSRGARDSMKEALHGCPANASWEVIENFTLLQSSNTKNTLPPDQFIFAKPVILGIGRLAEAKAFERLIRAHACLCAHGLTHNLVILGEGPDRTKLEEEIRRLGVSDSAFLPGHVSNVTDWLQHATVFALCSRYEGLPLVLLEAISSGTASVAMDCPSGPREILQNGRAGILVPEGDEAAFQKALAELLESPEQRKLYAARGREKSEFYSPDRVVPLWEAVLEKAASRDC